MFILILILFYYYYYYYFFFFIIIFFLIIIIRIFLYYYYYLIYFAFRYIRYISGCDSGACVCVVRRLNVNVWWLECLLYACLFARRQMPWSSLQGVVDTSRLHFAAAVFAREWKKKKKKKKKITFL